MAKETGPQWQAVQGRTWAWRRHVGRRKFGRLRHCFGAKFKGCSCVPCTCMGSWAVMEVSSCWTLANILDRLVILNLNKCLSVRNVN